MVKLRAGKKKQAAVKDSGVVTSEFKKVHRMPSFPKINWSQIKTKRGMVIVVTALFAIAAVTAFILWRVQEARKPVVTKLPTQQEYVTGSITNLEQSAPAASASEQEQLQYYDKIQSFYDLNGDYENAAEAFEKRASLKSSDLDYEDYSRAARFYRETGNKEKGAAAVDKAISLLPATANEATGYDPAKEKEALLALKQEIQK